MQFDHIGVVVRRLDTGRDHLSRLFEIDRWTAEFDDPVNMVRVQFALDPSGICYELVAPFGDESPIAEVLRTGNRILNHVAYLVDDLAAAAARLRAARCVPAGPAKPAIAYSGRNIQFFVSPVRIIVELIEAPEHRHIYTPFVTDILKAEGRS